MRIDLFSFFLYNKLRKCDKMKEKIDNYKYELELWNKGINLIAGVDEVGRGPLIGPVVAAAVILPKDFVLEGLTDSKKLSEKKREAFYQIIKEKAIINKRYLNIPMRITALLLLFRTVHQCLPLKSLLSIVLCHMVKIIRITG